MNPDPAIQAFDEAIQRAEKIREDLDVEIRGLRMARDRRLRELTPMGGAVGATGSFSPEAAAWRRLSRTDAVLRVLAEAEDRRMHRKRLTDRLHELGRDDSIEAVSAALAYLGKERKVMSLGQGWWRLGPPDESPFGDDEYTGIDHEPDPEPYSNYDEEPF